MKLRPTPVKEVALSLGLPLQQEKSVNKEHFIEFVRNSGAKVALVLSFGQILSQKLLDSLPAGFFNIHLSLLPKLRGAAPVPWAIARGYSLTGVTTFKIVKELDAGPVFAKRSVRIAPDETSASLFCKLYEPSLELAIKTLQEVCDDMFLIPQDESKATFARSINTSEGRLNFMSPVWKLDKLVRAFSQRPGTFCFWHNRYDPKEARGESIRRLRILDLSHPIMPDTGHSAGGIITAHDKEGLFVQCGLGVAKIEKLRPEGKRTITGEEFVRGYRPSEGDRLLNYGDEV